MERKASQLGRQTYSVAAAADAIGVAPATLRTWVRRHDVGPSSHATGSHRRYTEDDVARLLYMRALIVGGASVAEAAASAREVSDTGMTREFAQQALDAALNNKFHQAREMRGEDSAVTLVHTAAPNGDALAGNWTAPFGGNKPTKSQPTTHLSAAPELGESSGSNDVTDRSTLSAVPAPMPRMLSLAPSASSAPESAEQLDYRTRCTQLVDAALRADEPRAAALIELDLEENLIDWFKFLIRPALARLASHTVLARPGHSPKVMISHEVQRNLARRMAQTRPDLQARTRPHPSQLRNIVLVFAPQRDKIAIPAHVFAAALLERGANAHIILGPGNTKRVSELIKMVRPRSIAFVSDLPDPDADTVSQIATEFPELPVFVALPEAGDLTELRSFTQVTSMRSYRALFHEVSNMLEGAALQSEYWGDAGENMS